MALQGKTLLLITNSDYQYTNRMMSHAYDRYLEEEGMTWRDLFDMVRTCCPPSIQMVLMRIKGRLQKDPPCKTGQHEQGSKLLETPNQSLIKSN